MPKGFDGFQKGNKLGKGRPKLTDDEKMMQIYNKAMLDMAYSICIDMSTDQLEEYVKRGDLKPINRAVGRALLESSKTGNLDVLEKVLCRVIGPIPKEIKADVKNSDYADLITRLNNFDEPAD